MQYAGHQTQHIRDVLAHVYGKHLYLRLRLQANYPNRGSVRCTSNHNPEVMQERRFCLLTVLAEHVDAMDGLNAIGASSV